MSRAMEFAQIAMESKAYEEATKEYEKAMMEEPDNYEAVWGYGRALGFLCSWKNQTIMTTMMSHKKAVILLKEQKGEGNELYELKKQFVTDFGRFVDKEYEATLKKAMTNAIGGLGEALGNVGNGIASPIKFTQTSQTKTFENEKEALTQYEKDLETVKAYSAELKVKCDNYEVAYIMKQSGKSEEQAKSEVFLRNYEAQKQQKASEKQSSGIGGIGVFGIILFIVGIVLIISNL